MITCDVNIYDVYDDFIDTLCGKLTVNDTVSECVTDIDNVRHTNVCSTDLTMNDKEGESSVEVTFAELHRIDVYIKGVEGSVKCLEDSGAQIGIIRSDVISNMDVKRVGSVKLRNSRRPARCGCSTRT